jgi:hypothetical protein
MKAPVSSLFVTGTDTGVGKTRVAVALIHALRAQGLRVAAMKPVAAGCTPGGLNDDVSALLQASNVAADLRDINPYSFEPPIAPHRTVRYRRSVCTARGSSRCSGGGGCRRLACAPECARGNGGSGASARAPHRAGGRAASGMFEPCLADRRVDRPSKLAVGGLGRQPDRHPGDGLPDRQSGYAACALARALSGCAGFFGCADSGCRCTRLADAAEYVSILE